MKKVNFKILSVVLFAFLFIFLGLYLSRKSNLQPTTYNLQPTLSPSPFPIREKAKVSYVFDGDTIQLYGKTTVRLLGIDAPETANKYTKFRAECFASESAKIAREIMMGQTVELEKDVEDKDNYGRLLRYVFLDDVFVNEFLTKQGFAKLDTNNLNTRYKNILASAEKEAREEKRGLWGKCY